jgi:hypothetical protein
LNESKKFAVVEDENEEKQNKKLCHRKIAARPARRSTMQKSSSTLVVHAFHRRR